MTRVLVLLLLSAILAACSTRQVIDVALSKDPRQAVRALLEGRISSYKYNPELAFSDIRKAQDEYNRLLGKLKKKSGEKWGKKEAEEVPTRTRYVKYTENFKNRTIVDFDQGSVVIEHLEEDKAKARLRGAIVTAMLTPSDPRAVDLFSDKEIELDGTPYMQGLIADQNGKLVYTRREIENYAGFLVDNKMQTRSIDVDGKQKKVLYVQFNMVNNHVDKRARQYAPLVNKYAEANQVSRSLVYAVIKTESSFNPYARSSVAYGLMQLVPKSGGRAAYGKVKGLDQEPSVDYLYDAENNIELGSAYLSLLMNETMLHEIDDPVSREYCAIAAYNTGPSNVMRAFSDNRNSKERMVEAIEKINSMRADEVYGALRQSLPYEETRGYIAKVVGSKKLFALM